MEERNTVFVLRLGREQLRLVGLDRLNQMRYRWDEKRHSNAQWELHLILQGSCRVDLEEGSCCLCSGQALLIPPGHHHRPQANPGAFERFSLSVSPEPGMLVRQLQEACTGSRVLEPTGYMLQLAARILREDMTQRAFRQTAMEAMLTCFLVEVFRLLELPGSDPVGNNSTISRLTETIDTYFEQHFADSAGEQVLADKLHISRRQLVRLLQSNYGMNFRQKLIRTRMDRAAWLLRSTELPVSDICGAVGYGAESAFFKAFRQQFGMTPNRYRQKHMR